MEDKGLLYHLSVPSRVITMYWIANSLAIMRSALLEELRPTALALVKECICADGGFAGAPGYPSTVLTTWHALQILFIYNAPLISPRTAQFLAAHVDKNGFFNDDGGDHDTRFDCCGVLALTLLAAMDLHVKTAGAEIGEPTVLYPCSTDKAVAQTLLYEKCAAKMARSGLARPLTSPEYAGGYCSTAIDCDGLLEHLLNCYNADGGFGQEPHAETHAAQIFCVLSALRSLDALDTVDHKAIMEFLVFRQKNNGGISGRVNKKEDVCYSFWAFASECLLSSAIYNRQALRGFIYSCAGADGGFSDRPGNECDVYHQMCALAALSLLGEPGLSPIDPGFCL